MHWGCLSQKKKRARACWQLVYEYQIYLSANETIVPGMSNATSHLVWLALRKHTCSPIVEWRTTLAQNFIWSIRTLEEPHDHPHWGKSTRMFRMWCFIWSDWTLKKAQAYPQWEETIQMPTMWFCVFTSGHSSRSHQNTSLKKTKINANGATLFNHKIKPFPTSAHPQWREVLSL